MRRVRSGWSVLAAALSVVSCAGSKSAPVATASPPAPGPAVVASTEVPKPVPSGEPGAAMSAAEAADQDQQPAPPGPEEEASPAAPADNQRAWLGVELEPAPAGVRVARVVPGSPAEQAGLVSGDVIGRVDGEPVSSPSDVVARVSRRPAGFRLGVAINRGGQDRLVGVTLGALPERDEIYRMSFVGRPAPAFEELATASGTFVPSLNAQRGKVLIVEFWAPWCVACRALIPHMNEWYDRFAPRGVQVVGITAEPTARAGTAAAQLGMKYPVAADETGKTMIAYDARAIPAVFIIDRTGTVRDVMVGYDAMRLPKLDELVEHLVAER